jgi:hypothetical protein
MKASYYGQYSVLDLLYSHDKKLVGSYGKQGVMEKHWAKSMQTVRKKGRTMVKKTVTDSVQLTGRRWLTGY